MKNEKPKEKEFVFHEYNEFKNNLPKNFAEELLFLELELEKDIIDIKALNKLLELYTVKESKNDFNLN